MQRRLRRAHEEGASGEKLAFALIRAAISVSNSTDRFGLLAELKIFCLQTGKVGIKTKTMCLTNRKILLDGIKMLAKGDLLLEIKH